MSLRHLIYVDWDRDGSFTSTPSTNRITNGDFTSGETGWSYAGGAVHSVVAGKQHLYRNGGTYASMYQDFAYRTRNGDTFTLTWKVANPTGAAKIYYGSIHSSLTTDDWILEGYLIAANTLEETIIMTGTAHNTLPWEITRLSRTAYFEATQPERTSWEAPARIGYRAAVSLHDDTPDTDAYALRMRRIVSVTPISLDMTSRVDLKDFDWFLRNRGGVLRE